MSYQVKTEYPGAFDSPDHLYPQGVLNEKGGPYYTWVNGYNPFVDDVVRYFGTKEISVLDLGCASGALVYDFLVKGVDAVGLEGSSHAYLINKPAWKNHYNSRLFLCDIGKPFEILTDDPPVRKQFDLICAWEVLEHLPPEDLPVLAKNIHSHLKDSGIFACSISPWYEPAQLNSAVNLHLSHEIKEKRIWKDVIFKDFEFVGNVSEKHDSAWYYLFSHRYRGKVRGREGENHTFWSTMRKKNV